MKETTCPLCGKKISIADETIYKQHILCPYCNGKFSYLVDTAEFSSERLAYAVAICQKNAVDGRYYGQAPAGARMYIGLLFYGRVFKGGLDANLYLAAIRKVEPQLSKRDWQYLLEHESDAELAAYYKDRMVMAHVGPSSAMILHVADYCQTNTSTVQAVAVPRETVPATCSLCGEKITVSIDAQDGQRVLCPYCEKKFVYYRDCFDAEGKIVKDEREHDKGKAVRRPTAKAARDDNHKKHRCLSMRGILARIKSRHGRMPGRRIRIGSVIGKIVVAGAFLLSLAGFVAAYLWYQRQIDEQLKTLDATKRELACYLTNTSCVMSEYHSKYSVSIQQWSRKCVGDDADAEKVRTWLEDAEIMKSDIRRLLYDFENYGSCINSKTVEDLKFARKDFEFRVESLAKRMHQLGFVPPVSVVPRKGKGAVSNPGRAIVRAPKESQKKSVGNGKSPPPPTEQGRLQLKVNKLMEELKRFNYGFDSEALKKEDLPTQITVLEEMLYEARMLKAKGMQTEGDE